MAAALGRLGFDVTTMRGADLARMNESLRLFARASAEPDVAVVFYAEHGLEVDGVNYLVPVDAGLARHRRGVRGAGWVGCCRRRRGRPCGS